MLAAKGGVVLLEMGRRHECQRRVQGRSRVRVFEWDTNTGETAHTDTVVAIKTPSPQQPTTWLSRSSGLQLQRVGELVFAFQPEHRVASNRFDALVADVLNLPEYAKGFPQNV
jgi:hypothetical protein